jgi:hypothetical protein
MSENSRSNHPPTGQAEGRTFEWLYAASRIMFVSSDRASEASRWMDLEGGQSGSAAGGSLPDTLGVVQDLPGTAAAAALDPPITRSHSILDL